MTLQHLEILFLLTSGVVTCNRARQEVCMCSHVLCIHMPSTCQGQLSLSGVAVVLFCYDLFVLMCCFFFFFLMPLTRQGQQNSIVYLVSFQNKIIPQLGYVQHSKEGNINNKHIKQPNNETISLHSSYSTTVEAQQFK